MTINVHIPALVFWPVVGSVAALLLTVYVLVPLVFEPLAQRTGDSPASSPWLPLQVLLGGPLALLIVAMRARRVIARQRDGRRRRQRLRARARPPIWERRGHHTFRGDA